MRFMKTSIALTAALALSFSSAYACAAHHGDGHDKKSPKSAMTKFDADGNGELSRSEFQAYTTNKFDTMDADKNGSLSAEEYSAYHGAKKHMKKKKMEMKEKMMDDMDAM